MAAMAPEHVRATRLRAQKLYPRARREDVPEVVKALIGVNAQLRPAMLLALRARARNLVLDDVTDLIDRERTLVRTWAMRGTLHLLSADDPGRILPLLGPHLTAKTRSRRQELGLDDTKLARLLQELEAIMKDGKLLTRAEVVDRLNGRGMEIEQKSQAPYHLLAYAGLKGLVRMGPDRPDGEPTYVLAACTDGTPWSGNEALAKLARRYLQGYGPASSRDFAKWSGLPITDAKKGWKLLSESTPLAEIEVENRDLQALAPQPEAPGKEAFPDTVVNLLPAFDTLVLGYSDRSLIVSEKYDGEVYHGGQTVPVVLVNGTAAGVWRYERQGKRISIEVRQFEAFDRALRDLVEAEAEDIGRLFGLPPVVRYTDR